MEPELKAYLDGMRQDLTQQIAESRQHAERLNQETREHAEQLNRGTRVLMEDLRHDIQFVAEGVTTVRDQLARIIADHEERITNLERRMP